MPWAVERATGSAADFHARDVPDPASRAAWLLDADAPALVLGSAQPDDAVDRDAARAAGVAIVRRRSGGGAVILEPGQALWVDVIVPRGDPLWDDDVGRAALWLGAVWATALRAVGVEGGHVHHGALQRTRWSDAVCFAGLGPGEVTVGGAKVVGVSQRRTRAAARFQCAVVRAWEPEPYVRLLGLPDEATGELQDVAIGVADALADLGPAFVAALP
jgi:lipoate-protein ligase A